MRWLQELMLKFNFLFKEFFVYEGLIIWRLNEEINKILILLCFHIFFLFFSSISQSSVLFCSMEMRNYFRLWFMEKKCFLTIAAGVQWQYMTTLFYFFLTVFLLLFHFDFFFFVSFPASIFFSFTFWLKIFSCYLFGLQFFLFPFLLTLFACFLFGLCLFLFLLFFLFWFLFFSTFIFLFFGSPPFLIVF